MEIVRQAKLYFVGIKKWLAVVRVNEVVYSLIERKYLPLTITQHHSLSTDKLLTEKN